MSKVLKDAQAVSSTAVADADEYSLEDFRREQREAREKNASVELEKAPKAAPASERVVDAELPKGETVPPKQEALTDEEKSARKHANDEKRIPKLYERLSEKDAEIARLNRELAAKGTSATPAKDAAATETKEDPEAPNPKDPKYAGENGWLQFVDDRADYRASLKIKADREAQAKEKADAEARAGSQSFGEKMTAYQETQAERLEEFAEAFTIVKEALETDFPAVSSAIAGHAKAPELIDYLGTNLDVFSKITSAKGQPMAMKIFRGILTEFEKSASPVPEEQPRKTLPKPPVNVAGRGHTPTNESLMDKAAEDDDFTTWRNAYRDTKKGSATR